MNFEPLAPTAAAEQVSRDRVMDAGIRPVWAGATVQGPAFTVKCAPGDNLMLHAALYRAPAGSVLVVQAADAEWAMAGGNVAAVAQRRGLAGFVVDGAVRDIGEMRELGFPVFARAVIPKPGVKKQPLPLGEPVTVGGVQVSTGDLILGSEEGLVAVPAADAEAVVAAALAKEKKEREAGLDAWAAAHSANIHQLMGWDA